MFISHAGCVFMCNTEIIITDSLDLVVCVLGTSSIKKIIKNFLSLAWWYQVRRQHGGQFVILEFNLDQVHRQGKLLIVQITIAIVVR